MRKSRPKSAAADIRTSGSKRCSDEGHLRGSDRERAQHKVQLERLLQVGSFGKGVCLILGGAQGFVR